MPETSPHEKAISTTYFSIFSSAGLAIIKGAAGYFGNSYALVADAIESTADIFASILVLFGLKYTSRPADSNHPYGHGRAEPLFTFLVAGFLILSAVVIAYESIQNIRTPHDLPQPWTLAIIALIIAWKEYSFRKVMARAKETNSSSLKADAWHHRSDAITSVAAFFGISFACIMGKGYESADDWAALFAAAFILYNCYSIFRPALAEIMDENLYDELEQQIREVSVTEPGILGTEKCWIRKAGLTYHIELHAIVDGDIPVRDGHILSHKLQDRLRKNFPELGNILIHIEPDK